MTFDVVYEPRVEDPVVVASFATRFEALDYYLTMHESVMLAFICTYLDNQNGIATPYPKLPMTI